MVKCPHCATENRADATFCNTCGLLLKGGAAPRAASQATPSATPFTASAMPPPHGASPANATGRLAPNAKLRGRYLILKNVGQGGMAAVYQAHDLRRGISVAIKEMSQDGLPPDELREALASFDAEARLLTRLRHPNLPRVYETLSEQGRQYLVMDYIAGETLEQRQKRLGGGALPVGEVLSWARQLCDVLGYLHGQRPPVIFRDLKPANVMLTADGQIHLIDFGIARVFAPGRTRDTQVLGTPGFAPPEQYGKAQTDARADVYALGCTLYQLLTGYDPGTTPFNLPPIASRNARIAPTVQRAIERATRLDRDQRYPTIADFRRDLLAGVAVPAAPRITVQQPAISVAAPPKASTPTYQAAKAVPGTMAARVVVQPYVVDFGTLTVGQRGTATIAVGGQGGLPVRGQITSPVPWLRLDKTHFDGRSTVVQVIAETSALAGATGMQTTSLQVSCDSHLLFVPVRLAMVAAAAAPRSAAASAPAPQPASAKAPPTAPTQAQPAPRAAPKTRPVQPKHAQPPVRRTRTARLATGLTFGLTLSILALTFPEHLLGVHTSQWHLTAPLALGLLLLTALAAGVGALLGTGGPDWQRRLRTTLVGTLLGFAAVLVVSGPWFWMSFAGLLTHRVAIPLGVQLGVQLAASAGGVLGADLAGSQALRNVGAFLKRYANVLVPVGAGLAGAVVGLLLTQGVLFGCLIPFGIVGGAWLGVTLARVLGFRIRPRWRYRPPQRRWRLYP